ncbi:MAG: hypothetical protein ACRDJE_19495 [Dehalococcoidia bacterium]
MTNAQTGTLVLKDTAGNYFLVSQAAVEQGRVPEEQKAEVEQILAGADVSGYVRNLYEVVTTVVWAAELGATTLGNVLAGVVFEATYGTRGGPTAPA